MDVDRKEGPSSVLAEKRFTRGRFLKLLAAAGAAVAAPLLFPRPEPKEELKQIPQKVVMFDFTPDVKHSDWLLKNLVRDEDKDTLVYGALEKFDGHGKAVKSVFEETLKKAGYKTEVIINPLHNAFDLDNIEQVEDELGNEGFFFNIDHREIIEALRARSEQQVVNFSFQVGKVGFWIKERIKIGKNLEEPFDLPLPDEEGRELVYVGAKGGVRIENGKAIGISETGEPIAPMTVSEYEEFRKKRFEEAQKVRELENPYVEIVGAYSGKDMRANLSKLFEICEAYPDKLFIVAAGNEGEDLSSINLRPNNLLMVAEWNGQEQKPKDDVYGADIYVDNEAWKIGRGSSFSTPVVSARASVLFSQGLSLEEVKDKLQSYEFK